MKEAENLPDEYSFLVRTSIKIKISIKCEVKMKMVYEQWRQLKMQFFVVIF